MSYPERGFNVNEPHDTPSLKGMAKIPPGTKYLWKAQMYYGVKGNATVTGHKILHIGTRYIEYEQDNGVIRSVEMDEPGFSRQWSLTKVGALEKALDSLERQIESSKKNLDDYTSRAMRLREEIEDAKRSM